jgi:O-antigen/teichoic acid export membrane protein
MTRARAILHWLLPYAASVALTKGIALVTIPLLTGHLAPAEFARLELAATIVEFAALALSFCAADLMHRYVGAGGAKARDHGGAITGGLALLAAGAAILLLGMTFAMRPFLGGLIDPDLLAIGLFAASLSSLIEAPLAWMRCEGRARTFLLVAATRAIAQTTLMATTLTFGYGAVGVMAGNATVDLCIALGLVLWQRRETGLRLDSALLREAARYAWPLLLGGLAMFALGNCSRFFLAAGLAPEALAHFALAGKLATIVALAMQPFGLWWNANRLAIYETPEGPARSAEAITWGFACLCCGVTWVSLCAPPLVVLFLPAPYAPAGALIPLLALSIALNECCSLANLSVYRSGQTKAALTINAMGACAALLGYAVLTPSFGIAGALAAAWLGHGLRLAAFIAHGARHAPMRPPTAALACMAAIVAFAVLAGRDAPSLTSATALAICASVAIFLANFRLSVPMPAAAPLRA